MKTKEIIKQLQFFKNGHFPRKALEAAIVKQKEITPLLLDILQTTLDNASESAKKQNLMGHLYAVYLLGEFKEKKAYPLIIKLLKLPGDISYNLFGDSITEDMSGILGAVCDGELSAIKEVIEDDSVDEFSRGCCIDAILALYIEEQISREDIINYYASLFHGKLSRVVDHVWDCLLNNCMDMYADELKDEMYQVIEENLLEDNIEISDIEEIFSHPKGKVLGDLAARGFPNFPVDVVGNFANWACFNKNASQPKVYSTNLPEKKLGRNDPCPCGSGKKYKKCCLH